MINPRILYDASYSGAGYNGVAHDTRQNLLALCGIAGIDLDILLHPLASSRVDFNPLKSDDVLDFAIAIRHLSYRWDTVEHSHTNFIKEALRPRFKLTQKTKIKNLAAIIRTLHLDDFSSEDIETILSRKIFSTDLSVAELAARSIKFPFLPPTQLDTRGYDALYLSQPLPIRTTYTTTKIVRVHDIIPLNSPETVSHINDLYFCRVFIENCRKNSIFICNSQATLDDLDNVSPGAGDQSVVIPCGVFKKPPANYAPLVTDILRRRQVGRLKDEFSKIKLNAEKALDDKRYLLAVSTLEPRKNYTNLILAWERACRHLNEDVKLIIVANRGWGADDVERLIQAYVINGNVFWLQNVNNDELKVLYSNAAAFASIPYTEGFGLSPLEAISEGVPTLVSDIPVFRSAIGDLALYVNPFDVNDITDKLVSLLNKSHHSTGNEKIFDYYGLSAIREKWRELIIQDLPRYRSGQKIS